MAAFTLESLVPRGSVRQDVLGYPRLGSRVGANGRVPAVVRSMQPLPGQRPDKPTGAAIVVNPTKGASPGAGRSRCQAGLLCRLTTATTATATAGWRHKGGLAPAAAANDPASAGLVAPASEVGSVRGGFAAMPRQSRDRSR